MLKIRLISTFEPKFNILTIAHQSAILPLLVATYIFLFMTNMVQFWPLIFTQKLRLDNLHPALL